MQTLSFILICGFAFAGPLRDRILERRNAHEENEYMEDDADAKGPAYLPAEIRVERDVPYGSDDRQKFDVYHIPGKSKNAPVIFMVHGGAWIIGDKTSRAVVENKVSRWVPIGFVFVSANYPMLPQADPLEQAKNVVRAIAKAQEKAPSWGADPAKFILMGHSAGAHLVSLITTDPLISSRVVSTLWLGTVSLDSAALDIVQIMGSKHFGFYDRAFGSDKKYWESVSPFHTLKNKGQPILLVCSSRRKDSCSQANKFALKAKSLGMKASLLKQDLSHRDVNRTLGKDSPYTRAVESFLSSLDETTAKLLNR
ncbi:MAG: alpha/beta hydrolase [Candidatus Aureabacteria bacterium]|nr:alpha/beta hydrolase [Candidatus Auribacterota bacterium]